MYIRKFDNMYSIDGFSFVGINPLLNDFRVYGAIWRFSHKHLLQIKSLTSASLEILVERIVNAETTE